MIVFRKSQMPRAYVILNRHFAWNIAKSRSATRCDPARVSERSQVGSKRLLMRAALSGKTQEVYVGAEYTATMGGLSFDHDVTRIVAGDAESLRARLVEILESMEYRVLNENPIRARRGARALARSGCSQD